MHLFLILTNRCIVIIRPLGFIIVVILDRHVAALIFALISPSFLSISQQTFVPSLSFSLDCTHERICVIFFFVRMSYFVQHDAFQCRPFSCKWYICSSLWLICHCVHVLHFPYSFLCCWAPRLILHLGCSEQCWNKQGYRSLSRVYFIITYFIKFALWQFHACMHGCSHPQPSPIFLLPTKPALSHIHAWFVTHWFF